MGRSAASTIGWSNAILKIINITTVKKTDGNRNERDASPAPSSIYLHAGAVNDKDKNLSNMVCHVITPLYSIASSTSSLHVR